MERHFKMNKMKWGFPECLDSKLTIAVKVFHALAVRLFAELGLFGAAVRHTSTISFFCLDLSLYCVLGYVRSFFA